MSAAAARRRKQLMARKKQQEEAAASGKDALDPVSAQLQKLLVEEPEALADEATAYEALQLAQSQVRKKVHAGEFAEAVELACSASLTILQQGRVSVASQLMTLLANVLRETHTEETTDLIEKLKGLHTAQFKAMEGKTGPEALRLNRLERDWLRRCVQWSSELGPTRFGNTQLQELLAQHSWNLSKQVESEGVDEAADNDEEEGDEVMELKCDAVTHMALAEKPLLILEWLKTLPAPTAEETKAGHSCLPADRDALLTRSVLCFVAIENMRDATILVRGYLDQVEERDSKELTKSYTSKEDGKAPSHVIFCCMLLRVCEKDPRTGPLFSWLLRSFKRELDGLYKVPIVQSYTTKIGKIYFNIQPPPSMINMLENMMGMMGGTGGAGGINPAMMQAMMQNM
ncbi:DUF410 domain containing protein [Nitzschia inconspicua]|uniref:DUF410 domain containing protein n=1 Tax=Nitzschia inconspicua TaxID=303405 RepID=A0A9K3PRU1_9STRA|nr:DUF410 domain containing protein [Nitzschia inconspicua]